MEIYILQVILFQLLFLLVYEVLLKKETFFNYNRWYLLLAAVISLFLPFIKIDALSFLASAQSFSEITSVWLPEVFIGGRPEVIEESAPVLAQQHFRIDWWLLIYGIGVLGSLSIVYKKYQNLERLFRFRKISAERGFQIIEIPNSSIACTFYKTIFLGDKLSEAERPHILNHELVHVKQKHSLDLVFFEFLKIILWFNPLIYIFQNKITALHEFIADADAVKATEKTNYYEQLLNTAFSTKNISFINQFFNHSLIKKRIVMLQRSKSKTTAKFKYLFIVPLMLAMLIIVACSEDKSPAVEDLVQIEERALFIQIKDFGNQSPEEKEKITNAIEGLKNNLRYDQVHIFDGKNTIIMSNNPETGKPQIVIENINGSRTNKLSQQESQTADIPFAVVEQVPVFPGCENLGSNEERKDCMSKKIQEFVSANFDSSLGKKLGLTGVNRIIAVFKISSEGTIIDIRARAPHPDLEVEAKRVIEGLPQMIPGENNGQKVGVSYSLPIVFEINE